MGYKLINPYSRDLETKYLGLIEEKVGDDDWEIWYFELWTDISCKGTRFNQRLKALDGSFVPRFTQRIDDCFCLDVNLQMLVEKMGIVTE
jgi:hypothetical protein